MCGPVCPPIATFQPWVRLWVNGILHLPQLEGVHSGVKATQSRRDAWHRFLFGAFLQSTERGPSLSMATGESSRCLELRKHGRIRVPNKNERTPLRMYVLQFMCIAGQR